MNRILHSFTAMAIVLALSVSVNAATRHESHANNNRHENKAPKRNESRHDHKWHPDAKQNKSARPNPNQNHNQPVAIPPQVHAPQLQNHQLIRHQIPYRRPTPPPRFRPAYNLVDGILGIALGSALNVSINYLNTNGYRIGSRTSNVIGMTNVMEMNMMWPIANLYYSASGLATSEFMHYSMSPDTSRYNRLYQGLTSRYGAPASINRTHNGMISASWFGYNNQFITLTYQPSVDNYGTLSYLTSLTIGN